MSTKTAPRGPGNTAVLDDPAELARAHLPLVGHMVNQLAARYPKHVDRSELWSAGALGLVDAARRYDPDTGIPFPRYAAIRIRGAIIDANRARDWAPRSLRRQARELQAAEDTLEARTGEHASEDEIATSLGITVTDVRSRQAGLNQARVLELDRDLGGEAGGSLADTLAEQHEDLLPEVALERRELLGALRVAVSMLPEGHRELVERYYFGGELLRDIAAERGLTEARISQLCLEAVHALRAYFATLFEDCPDVAARAPGRGRRESFVARVTAQSTWRDHLAAAG